MPPLPLVAQDSSSSFHSRNEHPIVKAREKKVRLSNSLLGCHQADDLRTSDRAKNRLFIYDLDTNKIFVVIPPNQ